MARRALVCHPLKHVCILDLLAWQHHVMYQQINIESGPDANGSRITSCAALSALSVSALCKAVNLAYSALCSAMFCLLPASSVAACVLQRRSSKVLAEHNFTHKYLFSLVYAVSQSDLYMLCLCASNRCQHQRLLVHQRAGTYAMRLAQKDTSSASCTARPVM